MSIATLAASLRQLALLGLGCAAFALSGCYYIATGDVPGVPLEELDMGGRAPTEIAVAGPDDVILTVGDALDIKVDGKTDGLLFDLSENRLGIAREDSWSGESGVTIRVTMPAPRSISIAGSGNLEAPEIAERAEISMAGSGNVAVERIAADRLEISMAGSGDITGAGTAKALDLSIAGAGGVDFAGLTADAVEISIAGSGDVALMSDGTVDASIAGSGDVTVVGSARCELASMGSGTLNCQPRASTGQGGADEAGAQAE